MTVVDTNLVIHSIDPAYPKVRAWVLATRPAVSGATRVEALGYHKLTATDEASLLALFVLLAPLAITTAVEDEAIRLRQQRNMDLVTPSSPPPPWCTATAWPPATSGTSPGFRG